VDQSPHRSFHAYHLADKKIAVEHISSFYSIHACFHTYNNLALSSIMSICGYHILHRCHQIHCMPSACSSQYNRGPTARLLFLMQIIGYSIENDKKPTLSFCTSNLEFKWTTITTKSSWFPFLIIHQVDIGNTLNTLLSF
jgi:hypothetical protein